MDAGDSPAFLVDRCPGSCPWRRKVGISQIPENRDRRSSPPGLGKGTGDVGRDVLARAIKEFDGDSADEFLRELAQEVESRLTLVMEHPEMP
jgi:hypothetical protein